MNKKSIKLNSANIITIRKNIDITINKYWRIIRAENLMSKKAIAAKQGSGLDLKSLYNQIVQLSEKAIAQLKMIKTLDPSTKAKKGLKAMPKREVFSSAKIAQLIHEQQLLANKFDANLEKFNNETSIEIKDTIADKFEMDLAA